MPLIWINFHVFNPYSVFVNALLMSLVEWLVVCGFFTSLCAMIWPVLATPYFSLCYVMMKIIGWSAAFVYKLPFSSIYIPSPPIWIWVWFYICLYHWCQKKTSYKTRSLKS